MPGFRAGQRVVVKAENGYDQGQYADPNQVMRGHYGHVTRMTKRIVLVDIIGHIDGTKDDYATERDYWAFYPTELEAAD